MAGRAGTVGGPGEPARARPRTKRGRRGRSWSWFSFVLFHLVNSSWSLWVPGAPMALPPALLPPRGGTFVAEALQPLRERQVALEGPNGQPGDDAGGQGGHDDGAGHVGQPHEEEPDYECVLATRQLVLLLLGKTRLARQWLGHRPARIVTLGSSGPRPVPGCKAWAPSATLTALTTTPRWCGPRRGTRPPTES